MIYDTGTTYSLSDGDATRTLPKSLHLNVSLKHDARTDLRSAL